MQGNSRCETISTIAGPFLERTLLYPFVWDKMDNKQDIQVLHISKQLISSESVWIYRRVEIDRCFRPAELLIQKPFQYSGCMHGNHHQIVQIAETVMLVYHSVVNIQHPETTGRTHNRRYHCRAYFILFLHLS